MFKLLSKKIIGSALLLGASLTASAQTARVQVIHNSPDDVADSVDVYLDGTLLIDNFAFRNASPFIDAPAGVQLQIDIAPQTSTSVAQSIANFPVTLTSGETYVVVADGITGLSTTTYNPAPAFDLEIYNLGREAATMGTNTDILVHHGSTDAPAVNVVETSVPAGEVVTAAAYGDFAGYLELATANYRLEIQANATSTAVASFDAPLSDLGLDGAAITVVASGFLDPSMNGDGPAFGLFAALPTGGEMVALPNSTARVQVIHNSPDDAADSVDVYLNGNLLIDNFAFRNASPFIDAPAGVEIQIDVAPKTSTSVAQSVANFPLTLTPDETYVVVADGITGLSSTTYNPAPAFGLEVYAMGREAATMPMNTDVLVHHGSTDAPTVDVVEVGVGAGTIVDNAAYPGFAGYLELATADYVLEVRDMTGLSTVASYDAPLSTLGLDGAAIAVVASGFLDPSMNGNGPAFGLFVALPAGGELVALPVTVQPTARVQVIHNSPDDAADSVDVYLNGDLLIDNFAFRTASPFIDAPAGTQIEIDIAPKTSTSVAQSIANFPLTLTEDETYVVVADGITGLSATTYTPAPAFGLQVFAMGREAATMGTNTDVLVHHGSTDAPTVDVVEVGVGAGTIVDDAPYTGFAGYLELATADYVLEVRDMTGNTTVASFDAPLSTLGLDGAAVTVVASGFLDPSVNGDGPAFGLWVALPAGGNLVALPASTARLQVIHNSADDAATTVDVYVNGDLTVDDFEFRNATPFIDVPAGVTVDIDIAPANSTNVSQSIANFPVEFVAGSTYVVVADGITGLSTTTYNPAPPFGLEVYDMGREAATVGTNTDVLVHHGSTDAPTVDVVEVGVGAGTIVDDASYTDFAGYLELATDDYVLDIRDMTGANTVATYQAPLSTLNLDGAAITVVASGFLDPSDNGNGPAFGLWVALAAGGELVELPVATGLDEAAINFVNIYPNPVIDAFRIDGNQAQIQTVEVMDMTGRTVLTPIPNGNTIAVGELATGSYFIRVTTAEGILSSKFIKQ